MDTQYRIINQADYDMVIRWLDESLTFGDQAEAFDYASDEERPAVTYAAASGHARGTMSTVLHVLQSLSKPTD